jgi:hypothetical protein
MISKKQRKQSRFRNTHQVAHVSRVYIRDPGEGKDYGAAASIGLLAGLLTRWYITKDVQR